MGRKYQVMSADGHVEVPVDMWAKRVPAKYRDLAPKLVKHTDGSEWWHMLEFQRENSGNLVCELDYDKFLPSTGRTYHEVDGSARPGCGNASQRLREQDLDGIDAEVLYPPVYASSLLKKMISVDKEAYNAIIRSYNDFLADEYCAVAPDRLIGNAMIPESGIEDAVKEAKRVAKKGLKSVSLAMWPNGSGEFMPEDDAFFKAVVDSGLKISPHGGFGGAPVFGTRSGGNIQTFTGTWSMGAGTGPGIAHNNVGQLIVRGVFDRFPELKFYFAETQAGWLPHAINWADEWYQRWYPFTDTKLKKLPSDYWREHCRFSFITDRLAMAFRHDIGIDLLMWGSDFPHSVGTFPHSREMVEVMFAGVPANERRQVLVENVCKFFDLDPNKDITPTPA